MSRIHEEEFLSPEATARLVERLASSLTRDCVHPEHGVLVGIRRGGSVLARLMRDHLAQALGHRLPLGFLDITFYRDDLATVAANPVVEATELINIQLDDKRIVLVDDVLFTGRTIRAALNALFDYGRPERVDLAVLVDRIGHRQLPICPSFTGMTVETGARESIKLVGVPEDGTLRLVRRFAV